MRLRDRDAIVTREGIIFRVFGYSHPPDAYVCDVEYAPAEVFKSTDPRAIRSDGNRVSYKFYDDEGWKFLVQNYPQYMVFHEVLRKKIVGVCEADIHEVRKPDERLAQLIKDGSKDELTEALQSVLSLARELTDLPNRDFGVFGSVLHGFHHPKLSDIDLVVYGGSNIRRLRDALGECYGSRSSPLRNEFETAESIKGKNWRFRNFTLQEYLWHQRRKLIYATFNNPQTGRIIKTEFEPVKQWNEIRFDPSTRIVQKGWARILARVTEDNGAPFIPSEYGVEPLEVLTGPTEAAEAKRVISYLEEFRLQVAEDETVCVEGNLEEVKTRGSSYHQIVLTYCPRYYEQVLKVAD